MPSPSPLSRLLRRALTALLLLLVHAAWGRPAADCEHLRLVLAPRLTPEVLQRDWATGAEHDEANATLELRGCRDELLDRLVLAPRWPRWTRPGCAARRCPPGW